MLCKTGIGLRYYAILQQHRKKRLFLLNTDKKQIGYYVYYNRTENGVASFIEQI